MGGRCRFCGRWVSWMVFVIDGLPLFVDVLKLVECFQRLCSVGVLGKYLSAHAKGPGFDTPIAQHVQILISRAFTYSAVGSLVLSWFWA